MTACGRKTATGSGVVPEEAIERMLDRWEIPEQYEAHRVEYVSSPK